jgi:hypothetical protein
MNTDIGKELYSIMDALVALRINLKCDPCVPGEVLVLSAQTARDACEAIDAASASIRQLAAVLGSDDVGAPLRH